MVDGHTVVEITNLEDLKDMHECKAGNTLTQIQISLGRMDEIMTAQSVTMEELSCRFEEMTRQVQQIILDRHECYKIEELKNVRGDIKELYGAIAVLKDDYQQRQGAGKVSGKWEDRVAKYIDYIVLAVVVAVIMFFLQGGHLPV